MRAGVVGVDGTDEVTGLLRINEPEETDVAVVDVDDDRDRVKLALVEMDLLDWFEYRANCFCARLSYEAFFVCEGDRRGTTGATLASGRAMPGDVTPGGSFWPGAVK